MYNKLLKYQTNMDTLLLEINTILRYLNNL